MFASDYVTNENRQTWSFGIITDGKNQYGVEAAINSIKDQAQQRIDYEIILVGGPRREDVRLWIPFDETERPGWITRKKNIVAQYARYQNLCIMHDYYELEQGWFDGWIKFDKEWPFGRWNVCINPLTTAEGKRHSDWLLNPDYIHRYWRANPALAQTLHTHGDPKYVCGLPYNLRGLEKLQYVSGGYIVTTKKFLLEHPFNEVLTWGLDEDVEWSTTINNYTKILFNPFSSAKINRPNKWALELLPEAYLEGFAKFYGQKITYV